MLVTQPRRHASPSNLNKFLLAVSPFVCEMMENSCQVFNGDGLSNGHNNQYLAAAPQSPRLSWLDIRLFYVRFGITDDSATTPEYLTLNHIPLDPSTIVEVNGVRRAGVHSSCYDSTGVFVLLRRDRLDEKSGEVAFVTTDSIRVTGGVKFEVLRKDGVLVLSGVLGVSERGGGNGHGCAGSREGLDHKRNSVSRIWNLTLICETDLGSAGLKGKDSTADVYVAGSFLGNPIILTKSIHVGPRRKKKKPKRNGMLTSIAEAEYDETEVEDKYALPAPSRPDLQGAEYQGFKPELEAYSNRFYHGTTEFLRGEDDELLWFNAGVRVGVGIGLSVCLGVGIGVGLLVKTFQGPTQGGFRRRPL